MAIVLTACQPLTPPLETTPVATATRTPIRATATPIPVSMIDVDSSALQDVTLEIWHPFFGAADQEFTSQITRFTQENEWGIAVIGRPFRGSMQWLQEGMTEAIELKRTPSLVVALPEHALLWHEQGVVQVWDDFLFDVEWGLKENELNDIPPVFLAQGAVDGKYFSLPAERWSRFLLYNRTWARELGFNEPPASAQEFRQQACVAHRSYLQDENKENDGFGGWIIDADPLTMLAWMYAFEGGAVQNREYAFKTDANQEALSYLMTLYADGCAWLSAENPTHDQFARRRGLFAAASLTEFDQVMERFAAQGNTDEWTVLPFYGENQSAIVASGLSYVLLENDPAEQLAAWLFVKWMLDPGNQASWVQATGSYPLRASAWEGLSSYRAAQPQWVAAVELIPQAKKQPQLASWRRVRLMLSDSMTQMFRVNVSLENIPILLRNMDLMAAELSE